MPTRRWISYYESAPGDLRPSIGAGATEAEALAEGRALLPSLADGMDPRLVYALCFDLYEDETDVPDGVAVHTRGLEYLDGEHAAGVLVEP